MRNLILFSSLFLLASCGGGAKSVSAVASYDLGARPEGNRAANLAYVRNIEVFSTGWLDSSAMQYRLSYAANQKRQNFAESRWAAPPAELLTHSLRRRLLAGEASGACRIRIDLDEFIQSFDSTKESRVVLEARAQLLAPVSGTVIDRRGFSLSRTTATPDAAGGAAAMAEVADAFAGQLHEWLNRPDPQENKKIEQGCKG